MDDDQRLRRARQAVQELSETGATFDRVRADLIKAWADSPLADAETREKLFLSVRALDAVRSALQRTADDATVIAHVLKVING